MGEGVVFGLTAAMVTEEKGEVAVDLFIQALFVMWDIKVLLVFVFQREALLRSKL